MTASLDGKDHLFTDYHLLADYLMSVEFRWSSFRVNPEMWPLRHPLICICKEIAH